MELYNLYANENDKGGKFVYFDESNPDLDFTILKYFLQVLKLSLYDVVYVYITWSNTEIASLDCLKFTEPEVDELVLTQFIFH
jgi:hypothetical protein